MIGCKGIPFCICPGKYDACKDNATKKPCQNLAVFSPVSRLFAGVFYLAKSHPVSISRNRVSICRKCFCAALWRLLTAFCSLALFLPLWFPCGGSAASCAILTALPCSRLWRFGVLGFSPNKRKLVKRYRFTLLANLCNGYRCALLAKYEKHVAAGLPVVSKCALAGSFFSVHFLAFSEN